MDQAGPEGQAEVDRRDRTDNPAMEGEAVDPGMDGPRENGPHGTRILGAFRKEWFIPAASPRW